MNAHLDKWIKDARDDVPDSGEYRRLNRGLLKERMGIMGTSRRRRHHRLLVSTISLVFILGMSGQVSQLGSDSFDSTTSTRVLDRSGDTVTIHESGFRKTEVNLPEDFSEYDAEEYFRSMAAGEGELFDVSGISYGGKTIWLKRVRKIINGKENIGGADVLNPKSEKPHGYGEFMKTKGKNLYSRVNSEPPHGTTQLIVDGVLVDFEFWTYEYPGYGKVTRYFGIPVEKN